MSKVSFVQKWFMAIRPSSLILSAAPVLLGTLLAFADGVGHWRAAFFSFLGAFLLHILVNLVNDYCDLKKGADKEGDYDPMRGILVGAIPSEEMKTAIEIVIALFLVPAAYLILRGGWPITVIAVTAVASAIFYTAGKRPLGYRGFGDLLVFVFFGPVAVAGTYYVQSLEMNPAILLAGIAPGLFAAGVLMINNLRDRDRDKAVNKKTLVVLFGKEFGWCAYHIFIFFACMLPLLIYLLTKQHEITFIAAGVYFLLLPAMRILARDSERDAMNQALGLTVQACFIYCVLFGIGWFF
ncbi:MAG TPA: 1,4-dihydroxy-2-naphthoate octaprenyltransferase [Candidatus Omnitrophota bacterium]|nr:1,4-dihydroxy-2-naphthoate octaprenyltransferase [Candidatus Omnitrophota bacterium]